MSPELDLYDRERSIVVEAAAGAGKTYRLVRRYLAAVVLDGDLADLERRVQRVAAVTFTRAAASEMRARALAELGRPLEKVPADDSIVRQCLERLGADGRRRLRQALAGAPIDTLHGLCGRLLREVPEISGVAPDARVIEPEDDGVRCDRFVAHFLDPILDDDTHELHADVRQLLGELPQSKVRDELRAIVGATHDLPAKWESAEQVHEIRLGFVRGIEHDVLAALAPMLAPTADALEQYASTGNSAAHRSALVTAGRLRASTQAMGGLATGVDPDVVLLVKSALSSSGIKAPKGNAALSAIDDFNRVREEARRVRGTVIELGTDPDVRHAARIARWVRIGRAARAAYRAELEREGLLRYDDLERRALILMNKPGDALLGRFAHLLVDEFQDTNQAQVKILDGLRTACGDVRTFYVGDPKQSIYRFRGAEVHVFEQQVALATVAGELARLDESRRPSPELNAFFNAWFPRILGETSDIGPLDGEAPIPTLLAIADRAPVAWPLGGVKEARCKSDLEDPRSTKPVHLLLREKVASADKGADAAGDEGGEAARVAAYLRGLLDGARLAADNPPEGFTALRPRDVAILVPKWSVAEGFRAELEARGVSAQLGGGRGLRSLPEVRDLINLVRYLASWRDDLAAVGVLRGPMFALSDLGMYVLARWPGVRRVSMEGVAPFEAPPKTWPLAFPRSLHEVLRDAGLDPVAAVDGLVAAKVLDESERDARRSQLEQDAASLEAGRSSLAGIVMGAGVRPTADLLADAIAVFRLEAHWYHSPRAERAVANAWKFVELVRRVEADGPDPRRVVDWLDTEADPSPEGLIDADLDAVTITTVHGFKGQERPVIVLAGLGLEVGGGSGATFRGDEIPGLTDPGARVRIPRVQQACGGFETAPDPLGATCSTLDKPLEVAELKRLLYVGMTRACDRLVLSGDLGAKTALIGDDARVATAFLPCSRKKLAAQPSPLFVLDTRAELVVGGLGLTCTNGVFRLAPGSTWSRWVEVVEDDALDHAKSPPVSTALPSRSIDEEAMAWRASGSLDQWRPSDARRAEPPELRVWPVVAREAVALPDEGSDARDRGTLFHAAMEQWGFQGDPPDVARCTHLAELAFPGTGARHATWLHACVERIATSPYAEELRAAAARGELFHEVPLDAVVPDTARVTGRIDLLYRDAQRRWCVVDYKLTKKGPDAEGLASLAREYGGQLDLYRRVVTEWGKAPMGRLGLWLAAAGTGAWVEG